METPDSTEEVSPPSQNPTSRDHIFISYSHAQKDLVEQLKHDLEIRGHVVWIDYSSIPLLTKFPQEIVDAIFWSSVVLVCVSPEAVTSTWIQRECRLARQFGKVLIPLLLASMENPNDALQSLGFDPVYQAGNFAFSYGAALTKLLESPALPVPSHIRNHCLQVACDLEEGKWDADVAYYVTEYAQSLPMNARVGNRHGRRVDLLSHLQPSGNAALHAIVLGQPGAGKTVALGRLAWVLATKDRPEIPVLIRLSDYEKGSLISQIYAQMHATHWLPDDVDSILRYYNGYFLLDGLNEVPENLRSDLMREIQELDVSYPRFRLIVSSRIQDETWQLLRRKSTVYSTLLIQEIDTEDAVAYLRTRLGDVEYANEVWAALDPSLRELVRTPLILSLIKDVALESKEQGESILPKNRGELYRRVVEIFLRRDSAPNRPKSHSERNRLSGMLEQLALQMQLKGKTSLHEDLMFEILDDDDTTNDLFQKGLLRREESAGRYTVRYPHHTIQEYFTACALAKDCSIYLKYASDLTWTEVFVQLSGILESADEFVRELATINPWLAWWCVMEGGDVSQDTRQVIEANSVGLLRSEDVVERRRAVQTLAQMHLERVIPLLFDLLQDTDEEIGNTAVFGLWNFGSEIQTRVFYDPNVRNEQRIELARLFGESGDPRPGVGLFQNLPDIEWQHIQANEANQYKGNTGSTGTRDFWISRYPITNAQFDAFVQADDGYRTNNWWSDAGLKYRKTDPVPHDIATLLNRDRANYPVIFVSWYEAMAFCRWLSVKLGFEIRLPTETEWLRTAYSEGPAARKSGNSPRGEANTIETGNGETTPVGVYLNKSSVFNVPDILGNVYCWCLTKWRENLDEPENNDIDDEFPRVIRGSAFSHPLYIDRMGEFPCYSSYCVGIRLVRTGSAHEG